LVRGSNSPTHKLFRNDGSFSCSKALPQNAKGPESVGQDGQHCSNHLHKQTRVTHSPSSCILAWNMFQWAIDNKVILTSQHIAGQHSGRWSKYSQQSWCWTGQYSTDNIQHVGPPQVYLFAARWDCQIPTFVSPFPDELAFSVDALSLSWQVMIGYVYPSVVLTPTILQNIQSWIA
jgi:hypothetical protein